MSVEDSWFRLQRFILRITWAPVWKTCDHQCKPETCRVMEKYADFMVSKSRNCCVWGVLSLLSWLMKGLVQNHVFRQHLWVSFFSTGTLSHDSHKCSSHCLPLCGSMVDLRWVWMSSWTVQSCDKLLRGGGALGLIFKRKHTDTVSSAAAPESAQCLIGWCLCLGMSLTCSAEPVWDSRLDVLYTYTFTRGDTMSRSHFVSDNVALNLAQFVPALDCHYFWGAELSISFNGRKTTDDLWKTKNVLYQNMVQFDFWGVNIWRFPVKLDHKIKK